jgi:hypothetical protein
VEEDLRRQALDGEGLSSRGGRRDLGRWREKSWTKRSGVEEDKEETWWDPHG